MIVLPFKPTDIVAELGGGSLPKYHPNYDMRKLPTVDYVINFNKRFDIPDNSFEGVFSHYVLEHVSFRKTKHFLKECLRILKPGGTGVWITANLLEQAKVIVNKGELNRDLICMIFGGQRFKEGNEKDDEQDLDEDWMMNAHYGGFCPSYITRLMTDIGFQNINITPIYSDFGPTDMTISAIKPNNITTKSDKSILDRPILDNNNLKIITGIDREKWVVQHCELGKKILDIGSQDGHTFRNTPLAPFVTSIDLDKYDFPGFIQMDAHDLKFENKSFDIAILGEILEHVESPVKVLKEANRVSKRLLITVPDEWNWDKSLFPFETIEEGMKRRNLSLEEIVRVSNPQAKEFYINDNHKHLFHNRYYSQKTLIEDLEKAGITDYEMKLLQYGQPKWSFFVIDTKAKELITDQTISKEQIIAQGPIITEGPITTWNGLDDVENIKQLSDRLNDRKLKIALISTPFFTVPPINYGGIEQVVYDLAIGLDELGHDVTIFGPKGSKHTSHGHLVVTGQSIISVGVDWFEEEKKRYDIYKDIITPEKYDIIIDNTWFAFVYLMKMNNPRIRILHQHHGGYSWDSLPNLGSGRPNLMAISKFMQEYTIQYFKQRGYDTGCEYVHHGVDLDKYQFRSAKTDSLLFVGRLSTFKRPDWAIDVTKKTRHKLDIIGSNNFIDSIEYVRQLENIVQSDPNITLYANVSHDLKIEKMQCAKAILIPSKMNEPLNLVSIEGQACGTPIICTRDGGLPETIINGKTGFICDSIDDMVIAVNKVHTIRPEDCRKNAEDNFSRLKMAKEYEKLCHKVIKCEEW